MIYYVDSQYGSDNADGLTRQTAFKSVTRINQLELHGYDTVLFKAGCEYVGNLHPTRTRGDGIIKFCRYGVGEDPCIVGEGGITFELFDFDEVEVSNLSFTNPKGYQGIGIQNLAGGIMRHIHICNCSIHNVNDDRNTYRYESGGIICASFSQNEPGWFEDLLIEDNNIEDVARTGILLTGFWANRPTKLWGFNEYVSDTENWWPSKQVVVRSNFINRTGGDGIVLIGTTDALIEWNTVYNVMTNPVPHCANAGIWPQSSNNCLIQYNEVAYCHKPEGCDDAQGIDVDLSCRNTIIQYNYTHDNEGGALLLCELPDTDDKDNFRGTIYRNNLSINDGNVKGEIIAIVGPVRGVKIVNNTFCSSGNVSKIIEVFPMGDKVGKDIEFSRNILVSNGRDNMFNLLHAENFEFKDNLYWGACRNVPEGHENPHVESPNFKRNEVYGDGMQSIYNYIPYNQSLILEDSTETSGTYDLCGYDVSDKSYIGAIYPVSEERDTTGQENHYSQFSQNDEKED